MSVEGDFQPVLDVLAGIEDRLAHPAPVFLGPVTDAIRDLWTKRFASGGIYGGDAWAELSEETLRRRGDELNEDVLVHTGILRESLTQRDTLTGYAEMLDEQTLAVGTTDPAGVFAELGTRHEPRRQVTPEVIPDVDLDRVTGLVVGYLVDGELAPGSLDML